MTRFIPLVLFLFLVVHLSFGQDGPCLHILQNGTEAALTDNQCPPAKHLPASSLQPLVQFRHPDKMASVEDTAGWLKTFWIFGDGNFAAFPDSDRATEELSLNTNYTFHISGEYNVIPLMIEKKTNKVPPGNDYRKVKVERPTGPVIKENGSPAVPVLPPTNFRHQINTPGHAPDGADILLSSEVRVGGYETALAVSAKMPSSTKIQGVALLYYNSVKTNDRLPYTSGELFKTPAAKVSQARYTPDNSHLIINANDLPAFLKPGETFRTYNNVLIQPMIRNDSFVPAAFDEFRYFPIFTTPAPTTTPTGPSYNTGIAGLDNTGMGSTQFTVLILQNAVANIDGSQVFFSNGPGDVDAISETERLQIISEINTNLNWLNGTFDPATLKINGTDYYIRGTYHVTSEILAVIDPTELRVNKICPVENERDKFLAEMTMTVCNEGNLTEKRVVVNIFKAPGVVMEDLQFEPAQFSNTLRLNVADTIWEFDYMLNNGLKGAYESGEYVSSCFDVHFNIKTNWNGVEALQKGKGLTAKVHFTSAKINAEQYFPNLEFNASEVNRKQGYKCLPPDDSCVWLIVVIFALALVAWWYWKKNKEE